MKKTATILLVEDDQALLDGIADLLEISDIGYAIDIMKATNGLVGLEAIEGRIPDLIISDIMMPRMGGFEFLEQLRKKPDWVHIPVIFLTAKGTSDDILKGRLSGAELYITKPYDSDELLQLVRSQLKRAFELRVDRQRRMDTFSRNIVQLLNHEFRTPLTYVTAYYELLADGVLRDDPESVREYLKGIQVGTARLSKLVGNLVRILELRTGDIPKYIEQQSETIEDIAEMLQGLCEQEWLDEENEIVYITCDTPVRLPSIFGHRPSIITIFDCLLDNAVKFSLMNPDRPPSIILSATVEDEMLAISVEDNGIGIPVNVHQRIFDLFYQHNREDLEQQGAGTGLAIAQGLVELHGGYMEVESAENQGSIFTVYLPVQNGEPAARLAQLRRRAVRKSATILLVEDEWFLLEGLSDLLGVFDGAYELSILTASDGKQALQVLEEQEPDLIITDIMMPRMDGYEFLREVRKNPAWLQIPCIFLTAKGERDDIVRGRTSGAEEYVTKPYDANELFAVIKTQLDRHFQRKGAVEQDFKDLKQSILDLLLDDLRMPLEIVSDYTEKIAGNVNNLQSDQDLVVYLRGIQSGSSQVSRLVQDFMLLVELQTGKSVDWFALQARPTNVNNILSKFYSIEWSPVNQPQVNFRIDLADELGYILIDPDLLAKCIERLVGLLVALGNEYGEIDITLNTRRTHDRIQITVGTTAVSLTEDEAEKVNVLLAKSDPVVLELSEYDPALLITKGIVHHHEGTVTIKVIENERLDFVVSFPVYQPAVEAHQII